MRETKTPSPLIAKPNIKEQIVFKLTKWTEQSFASQFVSAFDQSLNIAVILNESRSNISSQILV